MASEGQPEPEHTAVLKLVWPITERGSSWKLFEVKIFCLNSFGIQRQFWSKVDGNRACGTHLENVCRGMVFNDAGSGIIDFEDSPSSTTACPVGGRRQSAAPCGVHCPLSAHFGCMPCIPRLKGTACLHWRCCSGLQKARRGVGTGIDLCGEKIFDADREGRPTKKNHAKERSRWDVAGNYTTCRLCILKVSSVLQVIYVILQFVSFLV